MLGLDEGESEGLLSETAHQPRLNFVNLLTDMYVLSELLDSSQDIVADISQRIIHLVRRCIDDTERLPMLKDMHV